jgi:hypothetical protein
VAHLGGRKRGTAIPVVALLDLLRGRRSDLVGGLEPAQWRIIEAAITITISPTKIIAGCGTLLPSRSMLSSIRS